MNPNQKLLVAGAVGLLALTGLGILLSKTASAAGLFSLQSVGAPTIA